MRAEFTDDENMRAYRLFNIIDVDQSGNVDLREIKRYMTTEIERHMEDRFEHPDCGLVWGLDDDDAVVIRHIEELSPASKKTFLLPGLRLKVHTCARPVLNTTRPPHSCVTLILTPLVLRLSPVAQWRGNPLQRR